MEPLRYGTVLHIIDHVAIVFGQAYQLARARFASAASPLLRMMIDRDHRVTELELLRRELAVLRDQRCNESTTEETHVCLCRKSQ